VRQQNFADVAATAGFEQLHETYRIALLQDNRS
jgi:hypothetical protein